MAAQEFDQKMITVPAALPRMAAVSGFIADCLDELKCSEKVRIHIKIAVDEVFSNIARHADAGKGDTVTVLFRSEEDPRSAVITFMDNCPRFDPLSVREPDISIPARERQIGGLGLFILKRIMDEVSYEYRDRQNILTIRKYL